MQNISFKGCIPVVFYAKHPITKRYVPIVKEQNIKKCQYFVVRNLNGTMKGQNKSNVFVSAYKSIDPDYVKAPTVRSFYDKFALMPKDAKDSASRSIYLFTGADAGKVDEIGKQLAREKSDIFEATGEKDNPAIKQAKRRYGEEMKKFLNKICSRVNDGNGNSYVMRVLFTPEYNKKGMLKNFKFQDVFFDIDSEI